MSAIDAFNIFAAMTAMAGAAAMSAQDQPGKAAMLFGLAALNMVLVAL